MSDDDLTEIPGVGAKTADSLTDAGFQSYNALAVASPSELSEQASVGDSKAVDIVNAARDFADVGDFESASDVLDRRMKISKCSFLIPELDELLGGGIETQAITEFYGEFGAGKSQITHQLAVNCQLPNEDGGLEGRAIFLDTEDTFRPERIDDMVRGLPEDIIESEMERRGIDEDLDEEERMKALVRAFLDKIHVSKGFNVNHQILMAEKAMELAEEYEGTEWPVKMFLVDSLTAHFRAEYVGRGELAPRQQKLNKHLHDIERLANLYNAAAIVTNQVQSNPDAYFGDPTKPIGGNILGHKSTFRLYIKKNKEDKRVVRLVDAPNLADGEAVMRVQDAGLKPE